MFANSPSRLAPDAVIRPAPEFEKILTEALDAYTRDLKGIATRNPQNYSTLLAYQALKIIQERGTFSQGHSQRDYVFMFFKSPEREGKNLHISLHLNGRQDPITEIGIDFLSRDFTSSQTTCLFRCYVRSGATATKNVISHLASLREAMRSQENGDDAKWETFHCLTQTGQYSESPLSISAVSAENYERMEALGIESKDPEDLAKHVLDEFAGFLA